MSQSKGISLLMKYHISSDGLWPDQRYDRMNCMIGVRTILWQVPIVKKLEEGRYNVQHDIDCKEVVEKGYVIKSLMVRLTRY